VAGVLIDLVEADLVGLGRGWIERYRASHERKPQKTLSNSREGPWTRILRMRRRWKQRIQDVYACVVPTSRPPHVDLNLTIPTALPMTRQHSNPVRVAGKPAYELTGPMAQVT
jgi:hypothetical protein